jgi:hypothetical protein
MSNDSILDDSSRIAGLTLDEVIDELQGVSGTPQVYTEFKTSYHFWLEAISTARHECGYGCPDGRMMQYTTLLGCCLSREDPKLRRIVKLSSLQGKEALMTADTIKDAKTKSPIEYSPTGIHGRGKIVCWNEDVRDTFTTLADNVGVFDYQIEQIYSIKALITSSTDLGAGADYFRKTIVEWERWLDQRAWDLYCLVAKPTERERLIGAYLDENMKIDWKSLVKPRKKSKNE